MENNLIVSLKLDTYNSLAECVKVLRNYTDLPISVIKKKIVNKDYILCYDCADRFGVKKVISCYEALSNIGAKALLYELDHRRTTLEQLKKRNKMYDEISDEIDEDSI